MGLFGLGKQYVWDMERSDNNKAKMKALFDHVVPQAETYKILFAYTSDVKRSNYIVARKTTYIYGNLILGYRESDCSIILVDTDNELSGCGEPRYFKREDIKKAKMVQAQFTLYRQGGLMAGYDQFLVPSAMNDTYLAYIYQEEEAADFDKFWAIYKK